MGFKILFHNSQPIPGHQISQSIGGFGSSYNRTVRQIIQSTDCQTINHDLFVRNTVSVLNNFKMTRRGVFRGLKYDAGGKFLGPIEKIDDCWGAIESIISEIKALLRQRKAADRGRVIVLMDENQLRLITDSLYKAFKRLLPITMSQNSYGLVGASKILFAVLPEIALPVDNVEWRQIFKTVDFGDVIGLMAREIKSWEKSTGLKLNECDQTNAATTLPAVYNVMAMKARP